MASRLRRNNHILQLRHALRVQTTRSAKKEPWVGLGRLPCLPCMHADDSTLGDYDTLVVNSGLHRAGGGLEEYAEMMTNASTFLAASMERLHGEKAVLVARNTVPGHGASYDRYCWHVRCVSTTLVARLGLPSCTTKTKTTRPYRPPETCTHHVDQNFRGDPCYQSML